MVPRDGLLTISLTSYTVSCGYALALGLHGVTDSQTWRPPSQDWVSTLCELISVRRGRAVGFRVTPFSLSRQRLSWELPWDPILANEKLAEGFWEKFFLIFKKSGSLQLLLDVNKNAEKRCWPLGEPNLVRHQYWGKSRDLEGTRVAKSTNPEGSHASRVLWICVDYLSQFVAVSCYSEPQTSQLLQLFFICLGCLFTHTFAGTSSAFFRIRERIGHRIKYIKDSLHILFKCFLEKLHHSLSSFAFASSKLYPLSRCSPRRSHRRG